MAEPMELDRLPATRPESRPSHHAASVSVVPDNENLGVTRATKPLSFHFAFLSLVIMVLIASLDTTMLSVALPVRANLNSSDSPLSVQGTDTCGPDSDPPATRIKHRGLLGKLSLHLLAAITQPLYTSFSDVTGRKIPLYIAFAMFAIGAVIFATAQSMPLVVLGRAVQGLGGGGLDVLNEVIHADLTTLKERLLYMGLMAVPMGVGTVAGPVIGVSFAQDVSWRWIGWINLPMVGASAALAVLFLRLKPIQSTWRADMRKMDHLGMLMFSVGCPAFAVPLSIGGTNYPWTAWQILLPLIAGIVLLCSLALYEARPQHALFPYRIFRTRSAKVTALTGFLHGLVLNPMFYWLPLYFQAVTLASPLHSAVLVLPLCCSLIAAILLAGVLVEYTRKTRLLSWISWGLLTTGLGLYSLCGERTSLVETSIFQVMIGTGIGVLFTVSPLVMQASVLSPDDQGLSVGVLVSIRLFGGLIGLAIASTAFSITFEDLIGSSSMIPAGITVKQDPSAAVAFIPELAKLGLSTSVREEVSKVYLDAMRVIWYLLTGLSGLGMMVSLCVQEVSLETEETGRQHLE